MREIVNPDSGLREQLEAAAARNATFIVLLRHTTFRMHMTAAGHSRQVNWTACNHEDCRRVAVMLGDRQAARPLETT